MILLIIDLASKRRQKEREREKKTKREEREEKVPGRAYLLNEVED